MKNNYPPMSDIDEEVAPWNKRDAFEMINATKTYSFSYTIPTEIPKDCDDNWVLNEYFDKQYPNLEKVFEYLKDHFKHPTNTIEEHIKLIAENAIVDDSYTDFEF